MVMPSVDMEYSTILSIYIVETRECWWGFGLWAGPGLTYWLS